MTEWSKWMIRWLWWASLRPAKGGDPWQSISMHFGVSIHVVLMVFVGLVLYLGHLSAIEAVQKALWDLSHHRSVRNGLGHAIDGSLRHKRGEFTMVISLDEIIRVQLDWSGLEVQREDFYPSAFRTMTILPEKKYI